MKLQNQTDIPTERVREIIAFVKPNGVARFAVRVTHTRTDFRGRAFVGSWRVLVRVGGQGHYPCSLPKRKGYLPALLRSREEALVHICAHELRHLWQAKHPRGWRVWGSRGRFSERDADAYAIRKVREWRRERGQNAPVSFSFDGE